VLYFGTKHKIYALDPETHTVLWTYNRERSNNIGTLAVEHVHPENPMLRTEGAQHEVSEGDGMIYLGTDGGNLVALDAKTGEEIWKYDIIDDVVGSPTISNGILYVVGQSVGDSVKDNRVYALKLR
jgi:outer membrane protein assembly factor BamB